MINYSASKKLYLPLINFFRTVKGVSKYKHFVPWCQDSWSGNKKIYTISKRELAEKYKFLLKNEHFNKFVNSNDVNEKIRLTTFDGGIKVGFNIMDFSYVSKVYCIEPNFVISITDNTSSSIFNTLESYWFMEEQEDGHIFVNYDIHFEFKHLMFSSVTNMFLNLMGETILTAFVKEVEHQKNEEKINIVHNSKDNRNADTIINDKLKSVQFDASSEYEAVNALLENIHKKRLLNIFEINHVLDKIKENKEARKKLSFYANLIDWESKIQINRILAEIKGVIKL